MANHNMDIQAAAGTAIGACLGFANGLVDKISTHFAANPHLVKMAETALHAFIGATIGFFATKLCKWLYSKITNQQS